MQAAAALSCSAWPYIVTAPVVADHELQACRLQELWHMGSAVAVPRAIER